MKSLIVLCVFSCVCLMFAEASVYPRGRRYIFLGNCYKECEVGTHAYAIARGTVTPEATCANPNPQPETSEGSVCDFSDCYCDSPTVRHPESNKCVPLEECPK